MYSLLDSIVDNMGTRSGAPTVVSSNHDTSTINWVAGMTDPGEMIGCGMYQQLRRHANEADDVYQSRLTILLRDLPANVREKIESFGRAAALRRASVIAGDADEMKQAAFAIAMKA